MISSACAAADLSLGGGGGGRGRWAQRRVLVADALADVVDLPAPGVHLDVDVALVPQVAVGVLPGLGPQPQDTGLGAQRQGGRVAGAGQRIRGCGSRERLTGRGRCDGHRAPRRRRCIARGGARRPLAGKVLVQRVGVGARHRVAGHALGRRAGVFGPAAEPGHVDAGGQRQEQGHGAQAKRCRAHGRFPVLAGLDADLAASASRASSTWRPT